MGTSTRRRPVAESRRMAMVSASLCCARAIASKLMPAMAATEREAATLGASTMGEGGGASSTGDGEGEAATEREAVTLGASTMGESGGASSTGARERASATTLSFPAISRMSVVYLEMFDSWVVW